MMEENSEFEYYNCDGCGEEFIKDKLNRVGKNFICDDCMLDVDYDQ
jgi:formylmethanofuran dehydrogenase subunit E